MPEPLIGILAVVAMLLVAGGAVGMLRREDFSWRWLLVAAALVFVNDAALTNLFGALPRVFPQSGWNWQGKVLALAVTLAVAAHPSFGWRRSGLTLAQKREGRAAAYALAAVVVLIFTGLAIWMETPPHDSEALAFQLTMPGLEEEPFYRGVLLLALNEAFRGRRRIVGTPLGWGAIFSSILFGLVHAFGYSDGAFEFDALTMLLTGGPALVLVWLRERTGSLLLPILLHNFGNSIFRIL